MTSPFYSLPPTDSFLLGCPPCGPFSPFWRALSLKPFSSHFPFLARATISLSLFRSSAPGWSSVPTINPGVPVMPSSLASAWFRSITVCHSGSIISASSFLASRPTSPAMRSNSSFVISFLLASNAS